MTHPPPKAQKSEGVDRANGSTPGNNLSEANRSTGRSSVKRMAEEAQVSVGFMHSFLKVCSGGIPELMGLVHANKVSVYRASQISELAIDEQRRLVEEIQAGKAPKGNRHSNLNARWDKLVAAWNACTDGERVRFFEAITAD